MNDGEATGFGAWFAEVTAGDGSLPKGLREWMRCLYDMRGAQSKDDVERAYLRAQLELARSAVDSVLADRNRTRVGSPSVVVDEYMESVRITVDGSFQTPSILGPPWEAPAARAEVADYLQERLDQAWPVCGVHGTGLHARVRDGDAVWWCRLGKHSVSRAGELAVAP